MALRNYSSTAAEATLSAGVNASATTLNVSGTTGFPSPPFVLAVDAGAAVQELVLVTNMAGTTLTVTRGYDSTVAASHDTGAVVQHSHAAVDFREANAHVNATSNVHGVSGSLVGTSEAQALSNKNLSSDTNTFPPSLATATQLAAVGAWQDYTPTLIGGGELGNGTLTGRYTQIGKTVHFRLLLNFGSSTTQTGVLVVSLPVVAAALRRPGMSSILTKSGGDIYFGYAFATATDAVSVYGANATGVVSGTYPFSFGIDDLVQVAGTYEAA